MLLFYVNDVKAFMNTLLKSDLFDGFEARGVTIKTFTRFEIGCARADAVDGEKTCHCFWGEIREYAFSIIKGKKPPSYIKINLCARGDDAIKVHHNAAALHMTLTYENGVVTVLTGVSQKNFSLDKELDKAWDNYVGGLFVKNGIEVRETYE